MFKLDHFYITVTDLDKAINFYEDLLQRKISHKEKDRWADFDKKDGNIYLGIYNCTVDGEDYSTGTSPTLALKTDDVKRELKRIKTLNPKKITEIFTIKRPALYKYFQFEDFWGNTWEVAEYDY